ncbi:helix-turn-helix domain-containing protein [Domibacillus iocasae]|uniref:HTH cro/C1-type domain-containing protein n=1 Tax=Domibacillus iocasae TaxID=1714016 RepID=A0A1E7DSG3_9BACI|nr:helix-turn-helix transcriptional regulator [Domibacillus iocasae]OES46010.1 hypothetical protein BA724_16730 [Domibacillus iocasae]
MGIRAERTKPIVVKTSRPAIGKRFSKEENKLIQNLIHERKKRRITQKDLAKITGSDQAAIGRLESMKVTPTLKTMIKILDAMDLKLIIVNKD